MESYTYFDYFKDTFLPVGLTDNELRKKIELAQNGDKEARRTVIENNTRLVLYFLDNYFPNVFIDKRELVSIGMEALIECIDNFDYNNHTCFSNSLRVYIKNKVCNYLKKLSRKSKYPVISIEDEDNYSSTIPYLVESSLVEDRYINSELAKEIDVYLSSIEPRIRDMVYMYYGFYGVCYSYKIIASKYDLSISRVQQIVAGEISKLGKYLYKEGYIDSHKHGK